jgi:uncharacterized protein YbjT (DUF2867 family)
MTRVAITGGTGFVGCHLAARLPSADVVLASRRTGVAIDDVEALATAFTGCDVVAHLAGINRELRDQTYDRVHVRGTTAVIEAARRAGVRKIVLLSFLRARPGSGSAYLESKWSAEQLVRESGLDYTILKSGIIYGTGDHFLTQLSHAVQTLPFFGTVGFAEKTIRPIPVAELIDIVVGAIDGEMSTSTVAVTGSEELLLSTAVRRVARVVGRSVSTVPTPVWAITALAQLAEWTMVVPLISTSQARMLAEGVSEVWGDADDVPASLAPSTPFDDAAIRAALPRPGGFRVRDLRVPSRS